MKPILRFASGQIVIFSLIFLLVVMILTAALFSRTASFLRLGGNIQRREQAINLADAGIDWALWQLNKTAGSYSGTQTVTLTGAGDFTVTVNDTSNPSLKNVASTGYVPNLLIFRNEQTVKVNVAVNTSQVAFRYATQTDTGGIDMSQSATITSTTGYGNVYSNGNITAGSGNQQTITGDAWAVGTIASPPITVGGIKHPNASPQPLPDISAEVNDAKTQAQNGVPIIDCAQDPTSCDLKGVFQDIGPKKYINGDLIIENGSTVTIKGPVWVTGNVIVKNGGTQVNLDQNFGSVGTYFVVDGTISIFNQAAFNPTNADPKGYILVVTNSNSTCPPCAMSIDNSGANAIFYAENGSAQLSNTASVSSLVAKQLLMSNSATLTYDSGLASSQFTSGPGGSWQIQKGSYIFSQ